MLKTALVISSLFALTHQTTYTSSLADCEAFAGLFANTCSSTTSTTSLADVTSSDFTCSSSVGDCAGTSSGSSCTWSRQLCVTCSQTDDVTYIRVQTNALPNRCYDAPDAPVAMDVDFQVKWQWDVGSNVYNEVSTQAEVDSLICDIESTSDSNIATDAGYTLIGTTNIDTAIGVGLDGVMLFNGISAEGVDPLYPAVYGSVTDASSAKEMFDMCLGHPDDTYFYHVHAFAPCIGDSTIAETPEPCVSITSCDNTPTTYGTDAYSDEEDLFPIGIMKDGHILYGPYTSAGSIVADCDVDVCNGAWINGVYGYYATTFHPYFVGCWGPGSNTTYSQECSSNPRSCSSTTDDAGFYVRVAAATGLAFLALFF